ncbi:MAG: tetratricopeptide repeat protein [Acidobacteriota bacterium]
MWLLVAAALLPFVSSLGADFVYDDHALVEPFVSADDGPGWSDIFGQELWHDLSAQSYYRPLVRLSFVADAFWSATALPFHITNLLLHIGLVLIAWRVVRHLVGDPSLAFTAAALFAVHPVHAEAVAWISARGDLLAPLLGLGSWWMMLAGGWLTSTRQDAGRRRVPDLAGAAGLFAAALVSKETAIALVPMIAVAEWLLRRRLTGTTSSRPPWPRAPLLAAGFVMAAWVVLRVVVLGHFTTPQPVDPWENPVAGLGAGDRVATVAANLLAAVRLLFWPHPLRADYSVPVLTPMRLQTAGGILHLGAALVIGLLIVAALRGAARRGAAPALQARGLGLTLALVAWLPASSLIGPAAGSPLAERYLVLPSLGWAIAVAAWIDSPAWAGQRRRAWMLPIALTCVLAGRTAVQVPVWQDDAHLFAASAAHPPVSFRIAYFSGLLAYAGGDDAAASDWFARSIAAAPRFSRAHEGKARAALRRGDAGAAVAAAQEAIRFEPANDPVTRSRYRVLLAEALAATGQVDEALEALRDGLFLDDSAAAPARIMGDILFGAGRLEPAVGAYREALRRAPGDTLVQFNLGITLALLQRTDEAESLLTRVAAGADAPVPTFFHLGLLAAGRDDAGAAIRAFDRFLARASPDDPELAAMVVEARRRIAALRGAKDEMPSAGNEGRPPGPGSR